MNMTGCESKYSISCFIVIKGTYIQLSSGHPIYLSSQVAMYYFTRDRAISNITPDSRKLVFRMEHPIRLLDQQPQNYSDERPRELRRIEDRIYGPRRPGPEAVYEDFKQGLEKAIDATRNMLAFIELPNGEDIDDDFVLTHYLNCREVALFHQAVEILEQGMAAYRAAYEDRIFIWQGNRCVVFKVSSTTSFADVYLLRFFCSMDRLGFTTAYPTLVGPGGVLRLP